MTNLQKQRLENYRNGTLTPVLIDGKELWDALEDLKKCEEKLEEAENNAIKLEWQNEVQQVFVKNGVPYDAVDGSGNDTGCPFEFTLGEIQGGVNWLVGQLKDFIDYTSNSSRPRVDIQIEGQKLKKKLKTKEK